MELFVQLLFKQCEKYNLELSFKFIKVYYLMYSLYARITVLSFQSH